MTYIICFIPIHFNTIAGRILQNHTFFQGQQTSEKCMVFPLLDFLPRKNIGLEKSTKVNLGKISDRKKARKLTSERNLIGKELVMLPWKNWIVFQPYSRIPNTLVTPWVKIAIFLFLNKVKKFIAWWINCLLFVFKTKVRVNYYCLNFDEKSLVN